jgi:NitT/TauT family transport system permease protein
LNRNFDIIILGAGAAGLFAAGRVFPGQRVLVLDHGHRAGNKILLSGGGKCNFTNRSVAPQNYVSENPDFCRSALARFPRLSAVASPAVMGLQALPSICWYPLAVLWLGLNEWAILFVTAIGTLFAVASATEAAIRTIPPAYPRAAATMGAKGWRLYTRVIFPAALPTLLTGMRVGWSFAWRSLMAAEMLFMNLGLGQLLGMGRELADAAQVVAVILVILALGLAVDRLCFARLERTVRARWGFEAAA